MKRVHQFKAGDLIRFNGVTFRIIEDARPHYGFSLWHREAGKCKPLHGPVSVAEARGEYVRGVWFGLNDGFDPGQPWTFAGDVSANAYIEVESSQ